MSLNSCKTTAPKSTNVLFSLILKADEGKGLMKKAIKMKNEEEFSEIIKETQNL